MTVRSKPKWKTRVRCYLCGKRGHVQKDYYERGERKSDKLKKPQNKTSGKRKNENGASIGLIAVHALAANNKRESHRND